jgi:hypothetical protein
VPALLLCCAYAAGAFPNVAPSSWHPIQIAPDSHLGAPLGNRFFGAALTGNGLPAWNAATDVRPGLLMSFEQWYNRQMPTEKLAEDQAVGIHAEMFTWEPWKPKPAKSTPAVQEKVQPGLTNWDIAHGKLDRYIRTWARDVARYPKITVYIRYAHEMNGNWYPWSHNPRQYVQAWRHIVRIFRHLNVTNARFVWSVSAGEGIPRHKWKPHMLAYWPGRAYVNDVGITMINFGGSGHTHPVSEFAPRINEMHRLFSKPVMLTEVDTQQTGRIQWMRDLASYAARTRWLKAVVWSQLFSRGSANMSTGIMWWQITNDNTQAKQVFRQLAAAAAKPLPSTTGVTAAVGGGS